MQPQVNAQTVDVMRPHGGGRDGDDGGDDPMSNPEMIEKMIRMMLVRSSAAARAEYRAAKTADRRGGPYGAVRVPGQVGVQIVELPLVIEDDEPATPAPAEAAAEAAAEPAAPAEAAAEAPVAAEAAPAEGAAEAEPEEGAAEAEPVVVVDAETDQWTGRNIGDNAYGAYVAECSLVVLFTFG